MKLSLNAMIIAGALFKAIVFLFISLMNLVLRLTAALTWRF